MNRDVNIKIDTCIKSDQGSEEINSTYEGTYYKKDDCLYVMYDEKTEEGAVNKCQLKVFTDSMRLKKLGVYTTEIVFLRDEITESYYNTPFGTLDIEVVTTKFNQVIDDDLIKIDLEYKLLSGKMKISEHKMNIKIRNR